MRRAWNKILADERIAVSFDLYDIGICLFRAISTEVGKPLRFFFRLN